MEVPVQEDALAPCAYRHWTLSCCGSTTRRVHAAESCCSSPGPAGLGPDVCAQAARKTAVEVAVEVEVAVASRGWAARRVRSGRGAASHSEQSAPADSLARPTPAHMNRHDLCLRACGRRTRVGDGCDLLQYTDKGNHRLARRLCVLHSLQPGRYSRAKTQSRIVRTAAAAWTADSHMHE